MLRILKRRRVRTRAPGREAYLLHKETARALAYARLAYFNQAYGFRVGAVRIKNQRRCWGSCSKAGNLNFNYKIALLPAHLADYIIIHELCHLGELNHSGAFWNLVARSVPDWHERRKELRHMQTHAVSYTYIHQA